MLDILNLTKFPINITPCFNFFYFILLL